MTTTRPSPAPSLPFGKHAGRLLPDVPSSYLDWLLHSCKLSSGLRLAVADELRRRGLDAPAPPPLPRIPDCSRCGREAPYRPLWQESRDGLRRIRAECACGRFLTFLPQRPPFLELADNAASETPILDALTQLDDLGIDLQSDGATVWIPWPDAKRVPPDLAAVVRQCSHQLARMIGRNLPTVPQ